MEYKAVLFDLDDTLLRTYPVKWEQHKATARRFYGQSLSDEVVRQHWGKPTSELVQVYYDATDTVERKVANYRSLSSEYLKELHDDSVDVLHYLSSRKVVTGLVTNASRDTVQADLTRLGVALRLFDIIQTYDDTHAYKPDRKVFEVMRNTLAGMGITDHILYVGDDVTDYHAATVAGIDLIGVTTGVRSKDDFTQAGASTIIGNLGELIALLR